MKIKETKKEIVKVEENNVIELLKGLQEKISSNVYSKNELINEIQGIINAIGGE